jgi:ABC-type transport system involved in multi-copper enzyme maturation permease subunit
VSMLRAEWIKLRTARSTVWIVFAIVALTVGLSAFVCSALDTQGGSPATPGDEDVVLNSLSGVVLGQVAAVALGVLAITSEYTTGLIRTTFTVFPHRRALLAVKAALVAGCGLVVGLAGAVGGFVVGQPILHGNGFVYANGYPPVSLTDPHALRAVVGSALYLGLITLLGFGVGTLLRQTAAAMTVVLGLLFVPFMVALSMPDSVREPLQRAAPMTAGLAIQRTVLRADSVPIGQWAGLGVLALWATVALLAALWVIGRRDA